jgi:hypothetical protein
MEKFYIFNDTNYSELIVLYSIYSFFVFNIQRWVKDYRGASIQFEKTLIKFTFIFNLSRYVFLFFVGFEISWMLVLYLLIFSIIISALFNAVSILISKFFFPYFTFFIGFTSFIIMPIIAIRLVYLLS